MTEIAKIINIKYIATPDLYCDKNCGKKVADYIRRRHSKCIYEHHHIICVENVYMNILSNPNIDPISGNMELFIPTKCICLEIKQGDILTVQISQLIEEGLMGLCYEGCVRAVMTKKLLDGWKFNDKTKTWSNGTIVLKYKDIINVEVINYELENDQQKQNKLSIRCSVKIPTTKSFKYCE